MRAALLALCLWLPSADTGLKIEEKLTGEVGDLLVAHASTPGAIVKWYTPNAELKLLPGELLKDAKVAVVYAKKPGTYVLYAIAAVENEPFLAKCVVTITGSAPPTPAPNTSKRWFIVVYDPAKLTTAQAYLISDKSYWDSVEKGGHFVDVADKNSKKAAENHYNDYVSGKNVPYPAVIICDDKGQWLKTVPLPTSREAFNELIKNGN